MSKLLFVVRTVYRPREPVHHNVLLKLLELSDDKKVNDNFEKYRSYINRTFASLSFEYEVKDCIDKLFLNATDWKEVYTAYISLKEEPAMFLLWEHHLSAILDTIDN